MYGINFRALAKTITPAFLRRNGLLSFLYSVVKPLQTLNDDVVVPWRVRTKRLVEHNGQTMSMEKMLNDYYLLPYSPNTRNHDIGLSSIIYIENIADNNYLYLFNLSEGRDPVYLYNNYDAAVTYAANEYAVYGNKVYISLTGGNIGNQPDISTTEWQFYQNITYIFNASESNTYPKFIVWVPNLLGGTYETALTDDNLTLRRLVDTFRIASTHNYLIKRY